MPATNLLLTIEDLAFPDFKNDDSKKNFRLLFTILANDEKGEPVTLLSALPPLSKDNWTWKPDKKKAQNYVPNDGKGKMDLSGFTIADRLILRDIIDILVVDVKIIDIGDKNVMNYVNGALKKLAGLGLELALPGMGGVFAKIVKGLQGPALKAAEDLLDALAKVTDKRLYSGEFVRADLGALSPGTFKISGKGVLKNSNDGLGDYSLSFNLRKPA